jgi:nitrite reductase/ring-hydroxylating ferredoxin subunit
MRQKQPLARVSELAEASARKVRFLRRGRMVEGFIARYRGKIVAYENECRHLPVSLDYGLDRFFTRDGRYFICQTHSALYEPLTGICVHGPCAGAQLKRLHIRIVDGKIWLTTPRKRKRRTPP